MGRSNGPISSERVTVLPSPRKIVFTMSEDELTKHVRLTEQAHDRLVEACKARYGTTSVRWSDAVEQMALETIEREQEDD